MASDIEQALTELVKLFTAAKRPPPDRAALGDFRPVLTGLSRDDQGLIMQLDNGKLDGGDSAHRTGVLAFCNSEVDSQNLPLYTVATGLMTRHPNQAPWNNPRNCSRDQLIGYSAGCWRAGRSDLVADLLAASIARVPPYTCQNTEDNVPGSVKFPPVGDLLAPHDIMFLRICAGDSSAALDMVGQLSLYLAIRTTPTAIDTELNQISMQAIICGQLDVFVDHHDNFDAALTHYWGGVPWRGQQSIADSLTAVINRESARYTPTSPFDLLLPQHLLEELRHLDLVEEARAFLSGNPLVFAQLQARFIVAGLRDLQDHIALLERSLSTLSAVIREATVAVIVVLRAAASDAFKQFSDMVENSHIDPTGVTSTMLGIAAAVLGFGSSGPSAAEQDFRVRTTQALATITHNTEVVIAAVARLQDTMLHQFADLSALVKEEFYSLVLEELRGGIVNANILLELVHAKTPATDLRQRLQSAVDQLRTMIVRVARFGPGTLGYCFLAYGVVIALLSADGDGTEEVEASRKALAPVFSVLLQAPDGPVTQGRRLQQIEVTAEEEFNAMQHEYLIGVISEQETKDFYPPKNGGEPVTVGVPRWDVTGIFVTITGGLSQAALINRSVESRKLGTFGDYISNIAQLGGGAASMRAAPQIQYVVFKYDWPARGSRQAIDDQIAAWTGQARQAALRHANARQVQPDVAALATGVKAAFRI